MKSLNRFFNKRNKLNIVSELEKENNLIDSLLYLSTFSKGDLYEKLYTEKANNAKINDELIDNFGCSDLGTSKLILGNGLALPALDEFAHGHLLLFCVEFIFISLKESKKKTDDLTDFLQQAFVTSALWAVWFRILRDVLTKRQTNHDLFL